MGLKRRPFLQWSGAFLGGLSLGSWGVWQRVLAAPVNRRLALLVGVPSPGGSSPLVTLPGCLTDVDLQRELLVERLGFRPADVLTLTGSQATLANVQTALETHLVQQAQSGDGVFLHFSGYGGRGADPEALWLALTDTFSAAVPQPLWLATLQTWLTGLATEQVVGVIDAGFTVKPTGHCDQVRWRAAPALDAETLSMPPSPSRPAGTWVLAVPPSGTAAETLGPEVKAGVFTWTLTQALWHAGAGTAWMLGVAQAQLQETTWMGTWPAPQITGSGRPALGVSPRSPGGSGVMVAVDPATRTGRCWLGGVSPWVLAQPDVELRLAVGGDPPVPDTDLLVQRQQGLVATVQAADPTMLVPGRPVRETARLLPTQLPLVIALDSQLDRIERVDATSALAAVPQVTVARPADLGSDCVLGRCQLPHEGSTYGLFAPSGALLGTSSATGSESLKTTIRTLVPQMQLLLAHKLLHLMANGEAARLPFQTSLERVTARSTDPLVQWANGLVRPAAVDVEAGQRLVFRITNLGSTPLYFMLLAWQAQDPLRVLALNPPLAVEPLAPGEMLLLPNPTSTWSWTAPPQPGLVETWLVACTQPLRQAWALVSGLASGHGWLPIPQPLALAQKLLQDLHLASLSEANPPPKDHWLVASHRAAILNFSYRVV
ncbi:MAG: caspase family protein [Gloeomargaritaceae cyanobacterium C42_A2020_066]|nr:caspase family protein [Gloeomargaritaceae cyanobacterium C42_A2020_066]